MAWLLVVGGIVGAWALLNVLCAERQRRVQAVDFDAAARRQALARAAERLAKQTRKNPPPPPPPTA